jgi:hypothetical protein
MHGECRVFIKALHFMIIFQNITAFLMNQNQQFEDVMKGLTYAKEILDPARYRNITRPHACPHVLCRRLRNHDLLTSLDVLTTGAYQRLPSGIKVFPILPYVRIVLMSSHRNLSFQLLP